jgi:parvulin-like peptidyl-prolyl isomerase
MKIRSRKYVILINVLLTGGVVFYFACSDNEPNITDDTLAVIGDRVIEKDDFIKRYNYFRTRTGNGVMDTYESRRQVLNNYVDEELLIVEAQRRGFTDDDEGRHERRRIEIQELLNAFNRRFVASQVTLSDEELKELFVRLNTRIKARHLYAPTKKRADSLYAALQNGASFEELAKSIFKDSKLRETGGLLGYFTVDDMEPTFEEAAYNLDIGEISEPVRTSDGWSIIRVDNRITKPVLTEYEYATKRDKLEAYWRRRKMKKATQTYVDSLSKALDISFNEAVVKKLYLEFKERRKNDTIEEQRLPLSDSEELKNEILVRSKVGIWNVSTFQEKARFTSTKQHKWIRSEEDFKEFISGLVVRDFILSKARGAKLHKQSEYQEKVSEHFDTYLLKRIEDTFRNEMEVSEDSLFAYYNNDPKRFAVPPRINLREIVLRDKEKAEVVANNLKHGASFSELAEKYSVRRWSAEQGGELGFLTPQDLGKWAQTAFSLQVGELAGPIQMDSMYVYLKCIGKKPSRIRSFEEARADVEETVRYIKWDDFRRSKIQEIRNSMNSVKVFPERLKTINLKLLNN